MSSSSSSRSFYLSSNNVFEKAVPTQHLTSAGSLPSYTVGRLFLSSLTLGNTSFFTRSIPWYEVNSRTEHYRTLFVVMIYSGTISTTDHGSLYRTVRLH